MTLLIFATQPISHIKINILLTDLCGKVGSVDGVLGAPVVGGAEVDVEVLEAVLVDERPTRDVDVLLGTLLNLEDDALPGVVQCAGHLWQGQMKMKVKSDGAE